MKKKLIVVVSILVILIVSLVLIFQSCGDQKHKRKHGNYNPPVTNEEVSSSSTKEVLSSGVIIGVNCTNKVGGINNETFNSFLQCVDNAVEEKGYNFSLKDKFHMTDDEQ